MRLSELFKGISAQIPQRLYDLEISGLKVNSKDVKPGDLFVAIKGTKTDGHLFIPEAISKGARAVVCNKDYESHYLQLIRVLDTCSLLPFLANNYYGDPVSQMTFIGITGTNGKTTTSYLIESVLKAGGLDVGVIGTLGFKIKDRHTSLNLTTPDPIQFLQILLEMKQSGVNFVVMEVSSHSLAQHRVDCCNYSVAVFTNLSRDHLDYHKNMEDYFSHKRRLFTELLMKKDDNCPRAIVNADDLYGKRLSSELNSQLTFGLSSESDIYPKSYDLTIDGITADIETPIGRINIESHLIGLHNLYNIMGAIGAAISLNVHLSAIREGISGLHHVPGRLQRVSNCRGINIFVDYAHTPDALQSVISNLRRLSEGRLIVVFGCGGDRDKGKRPMMGQIAVLGADEVFITSDNPRSEDPLGIIEEILVGIRRANTTTPYTVEPDREKAIGLAIARARRGDTVLIAGKGHEDYQIIKDRRYPFSDVGVAERIVSQMGKS